MDSLLSPKLVADLVFLTGIFCLSAIVFRLSKQIANSSIRLFAISLLAIGIHIAAYNISYFISIQFDSPYVRGGFSVIAQFALLIHIVYLAAGVGDHCNKKLISSQQVSLLSKIALIIAFALVIPFINSTEENAPYVRYILRVIIPQFLTGTLYALLFIWLTTQIKKTRSTGEVVLKYSLLGLGLFRCSSAVMAIFLINNKSFINLVQVFDYFILFGFILAGIGLIAWILENEYDQLKLAESKIDFLSSYDQLTGLANRNSFFNRLKVISHSRDTNQFKTLILLVGIDNFKAINESSSLNVGDQVLKSISIRLQNECGTASQIARMGGDIFGLIFERIKNQSTTDLLISKVLKAFSSPFHSASGQVFQLTASLGVVIYPDHGKNPEQLIKSAEYALYHSKSSGGNKVTNYQTWMTEGFVKELQLQNELKRALKNNEFILNFQPLVCLTTSEVKGFEVLVRWQHPEQGITAPNSFIPVLERLSLMSELDFIVLSKATDAIAKWKKQLNVDVYVAVNLAPTHFQDNDLLQRIENILNEKSIPPKFLQLEITENAAMTDVDFGISILQRLREKEVIVALDDFGTGYSSMSYLRQLPVDKIKIDRSFIQALEEDATAASIVKAITSLSINLGKSVVAEGIETAEQLEFVKSIGCTEGQGFGIYKPMPFEQATELLIKKTKVSAV